jgi:hypothetical protein
VTEHEHDLDEHDHPHPHNYGGPVHALTPILNVSSLTQTFEWFGKWGWTKLWDYADPGGEPDFGAVGSGPCEIFLCRDGQGGQGSAGTWMSVWVEDVDAVHEVCIGACVEVKMPPTDEPWGVREMHLRHPDGHVFRVSRGGS